jgi:hypothetical protein
MIFEEPIPFAEAIAKLIRRDITPSARDTFLWSRQPAAIRERAFFSSRIESARVLQSMRDYLADFLLADRAIESHGGLRATGRSQFVADMREIAIREGLGRIDPATGKIDPNIREDDLTDPRSIRRLQLIFDTQTESAQEYGYWQQGQDPDILDVFPAQRFIRIRPVLSPRPYHAANEGAIRRKDDIQFWLSMNLDFGVPWGPWGFASGMGVEDVDRDEAEAAGILRKNEQVRPASKDFNQGLAASVRDFDPDILAALRRATGGASAGGRLTPRPAAVPHPAFKTMAEAETYFKDILGIERISTRDRKFGARFTSEKQRLAHLQTIGDEMTRLLAAHPGLKGKLHEFVAVKSRRGRAHIDGPKPAMSTKAAEWDAKGWAQVAAWEKTYGGRFTTERRGSQVRDNFRHELGHTLSTPKAMADFRALMKAENLDLAWFRKNVSNYAASKDVEALADSFGLFTREDYQPGTLPKPLEDFLKTITI